MAVKQRGGNRGNELSFMPITWVGDKLSLIEFMAVVAVLLLMMLDDGVQMMMRMRLMICTQVGSWYTDYPVNLME